MGTGQEIRGTAGCSCQCEHAERSCGCEEGDVEGLRFEHATGDILLISFQLTVEEAKRRYPDKIREIDAAMEEKVYESYW